MVVEIFVFGSLFVAIVLALMFGACASDSSPVCFYLCRRGSDFVQMRFFYCLSNKDQAPLAFEVCYG